MKTVCALSFILLASPWMAASAPAQPVADFYRGRTMDFIVGYPPGAGFNAYGRALATHIGKYVPGNPRLVVRNMPGGSSLTALKYLDTRAPRDGSVIGIINPILFNRSILEPGTVGVDFRELTWIGNMSQAPKVCVTTRRSLVTNLDDLKSRRINLAGTPGGSGLVYGSILRHIYPDSIKIITGYVSNGDIFLAMDRSEVDGTCTGPDVIIQHKSGDDRINPIVHFAKETPPALRGVPSILSLDISEEMRQAIGLLSQADAITRPILAPPGVPRDRAAALQEAFMKTMQDTEFLALASKQGLAIDPTDAHELTSMIEEIMNTPPSTVGLARRLIQ
jgi:tripartite-type tricarboxylate transporter receptor subunit TctC